MLNNNRFIGELYDLAHIHDTKMNRHYDYENNLLRRTMSSYITNNKNMYDYTKLLEKTLVLDINSIDYARNFFNITVDKYYNDYHL